jgi:hypothetical protein
MTAYAPELARAELVRLVRALAELAYEDAPEPELRALARYLVRLEVRRCLSEERS